MKSILMSIQPYYAYLEMKGIKTLEVRKSVPKDDEWSRKVIVYVSKDKKSFNRIPEVDRAEFAKYIGKVAFEFMKGGIMCEEALHMQYGLRDSCLTHEELDGYSKGKRIYGYRITDLKIYDKPKELSDFRKPDTSCGFYIKDLERCDSGYNCERCVYNELTITRPPQSWQYVEEIEE